MADKRIIDLQRQVRIARLALTKIINGHAGNSSHVEIAEQALDDMRQLDKVQSSAGLLGWEGRRP